MSKVTTEIATAIRKHPIATHFFAIAMTAIITSMATTLVLNRFDRVETFNDLVNYAEKDCERSAKNIPRVQKVQDGLVESSRINQSGWSTAEAARRAAAAEAEDGSTEQQTNLDAAEGYQKDQEDLDGVIESQDPFEAPNCADEVPEPASFGSIGF